MDWMEIIPKKINPRRKFKKYWRHFSWYRDSKSSPHITINGKGCVARLRKNK